MSAAQPFAPLAGDNSLTDLAARIRAEHGDAMTAACPRPVAVAAVGLKLRMSLIAEILGLAATFARHAAIAAILGDMRTLAVRLKQLRLCAVAMIETMRENAVPEKYRNQGKANISLRDPSAPS